MIPESRYGVDNFKTLKKYEKLDNFLRNDDYEWLAWNWRKFRIGVRNINSWTKSQNLRRAALLEMIDENFQYFPSLK